MANSVLEKYVRSNAPALKESQWIYVNEELKKIERTFEGTYRALKSLGPYIEMPYGSLTSNTDQVMPSTAAPTPITFTGISGAGVTYQNGSQIKVGASGIYNVQFSVQLVSQANEPAEVDVFFRKNGVNIPDSNSIFTVPQKKSSGVSGHLIASLNFFAELIPTDTLELVWYSPVTGVSVETVPAKTAPDVPLTPSVIVTLDYLSGIKT